MISWYCVCNTHGTYVGLYRLLGYQQLPSLTSTVGLTTPQLVCCNLQHHPDGCMGTQPHHETSAYMCQYITMDHINTASLAYATMLTLHSMTMQ